MTTRRLLNLFVIGRRFRFGIPEFAVTIQGQTITVNGVTVTFTIA
jgi:hypothetical protein